MVNNNAADRIRRIEKILAHSDKYAMETLAEIKQVLDEEWRPDFSKVNNGDCFTYRGIEFIRLGEEQGGILCMTAQVWKEAAFDKNGCNDWRKSSARELLTKEFLSLVNIDDLLAYTSDLTADNGDTNYGKWDDYAGLLSCDLYRKYRKIVPLFDEWMWTCTPWHCGTTNSSSAGFVRTVAPDGVLHSSAAFTSFGLAPACIFKKELFQ